MLSLLIIRELKSILLGPRFLVILAVTVSLVSAATWLGIQEFRHDEDAFRTAVQLNREWLTIQDNWYPITWSQVFRAPTPFQVFVAGSALDIGRGAQLNSDAMNMLSKPKLAEEPVFALFRPVDVTVIVIYVLSLLAIILSFDAICGEKERGTLRLTLSNAVPRTLLILAKFVSSWLALLFPLLLAFLVAALLVSTSGIPFESADWLRLAGLFTLSMIFVTLFLAFGLFVSTLVHRPADAFMILLVVWVGAVIIVPKLATLSAGEIVDVPTVAEISAESQAFHRAGQNEILIRHNALVDSLMAAFPSRQQWNENYEQNRAAAWDRQDKFREKKDEEYRVFLQRLNERVEARKSEMQRVALSLARLSPASSFQIAAARLAGTDIGLKERFEDAVGEFGTVYKTLAQRKVEPVTTGKGQMEPFDVAQLPQFVQPRRTLSDVAAGVILDVGLLALWALVGFAAAYVAFLRYDVR